MNNRSNRQRVSPWFPAARYVRLCIHAYVLWRGDRCEDIVHSVALCVICLVCAVACDITRFPAISSCCQFTRNDGDSPIGDVAEIRRLTSAKSPPGSSVRARARARTLIGTRRAYYSTLIYIPRVLLGARLIPRCAVCILFDDRVSFGCDRAHRGNRRYCHHRRRRRRQESSRCLFYANSRSSVSTSRPTLGTTTRCTIARLPMRYSRTTSELSSRGEAINPPDSCSRRRCTVV